MYTHHCKGCQMGQSSGVLLKEGAVFRRCPYRGFTVHTYKCMYVCYVRT